MHDPGQLPVRHLEPALDNGPAIRKRSIEEIRAGADAATRALGRRQYEEAPDDARLPPEPLPREAATDEADLLVEFSDGRIGNREIGFHFNDHHGTELVTRTDDVDRASLAELRVRHLDGRLPVGGSETPDELTDEARVLGVDESVEIAAAPGDRACPSRVQRGERASEGVAGQRRPVAALDEGNRLLRQADPDAEFTLCPSGSASEGPEDPADPYVVHAANDEMPGSPVDNLKLNRLSSSNVSGEGYWNRR
jgi:hypothetical protein